MDRFHALEELIIIDFITLWYKKFTSKCMRFSLLLDPSTVLVERLYIYDEDKIEVFDAFVLKLNIWKSVKAQTT